MNTRKLLIGCSVGLLFAVALLAVGVFLAYRSLRHGFEELSRTPAELKQPRVLIGDGLMSREVFSSDRRLSKIQALTFGPVQANQPDQLCSASGIGALFLDARGVTVRYVPYGFQRVKFLGMKLQSAASRTGRFQILDLAGSGECCFLARDNPMGAELIGHDGKSIWQLGGGLDFRSNASDAVGGDLYGDGKTEFVASYFLGGKGIALYDSSLNELWSKPEIRASRLDLVDSENGKRNIACGEGNLIDILDPQGNSVRRIQPARYSPEFLVVTWPPGSATQYVLVQDRDTLDLYDLTGRLTFKCDMPKGDDLYRIAATTFTVGRVPYLAVVGSAGVSDDRSMFCIYSLAGQGSRGDIVPQAPLYQEVLAGGYQSIARLPSDDSGAESVLIGGYGQILRYIPKSLPREPAKAKPLSSGPGKPHSRTGP